MNAISTSFSQVQIEDNVQSINRWIFDTIEPYIKGRTLEINSGANSLCPFFLAHNRPIHLSDTKKLSQNPLQKTYSENRLVRAVHTFDFMAADFKEVHPGTRDAFDTFIALKLSSLDFGRIVDNIRYVVPNGGTIVLILPAYTSVYHGLEEDLDLWKRYNAKTVVEILKFNFSLLKMRYFNLAPDIPETFFASSGLSVLAIFKKNNS